MKKTLTLTALLVAFLATDLLAQGTRRVRTECEQLAFEQNANPRAFGEHQATNESIARNIARMQARNELATQIEAQISSVISHNAEQWQLTAGAGSCHSVNRPNFRGRVQGDRNAPRTVSGSTQHDSIAITQIVSQILTNTRPICENTYDMPDGSVIVRVTIEMALAEQRQLYAQLVDAGIIEVGDVLQDLPTQPTQPIATPATPAQPTTPQQPAPAPGSREAIDAAEREFLLELARAREQWNRQNQ